MRAFIKFLLLIIFAISVGFFLNVFLLEEIVQEPEGNDFIQLEEFTFDDPKSLEKWDSKKLSRKSTEYDVEIFENSSCVRAFSDDSASALFTKTAIPALKWPIISWDWYVEKFPDRKEDETLDRKKEFDFGAQVYVIFHARFVLKSKAIQYIWAKDMPVGSISDSPYTRNVKLLVLESGKSGAWKQETRNIKDDYKMLFGEELKKDIVALSFMTDADSTNSTAIAYYDNIKLGYLGDVEHKGQEGENMSVREGWISAIRSKFRRERIKKVFDAWKGFVKKGIDGIKSS